LFRFFIEDYLEVKLHLGAQAPGADSLHPVTVHRSTRNRAAREGVLQSPELDEQRGDRLALQFQHPERTLAEAEIQEIQDRMVAAVTRELGGRLRTR